MRRLPVSAPSPSTRRHGTLVRIPKRSLMRHLFAAADVDDETRPFWPASTVPGWRGGSAQAAASTNGRTRPSPADRARLTLPLCFRGPRGGLAVPAFRSNSEPSRGERPHPHAAPAVSLPDDEGDTSIRRPALRRGRPLRWPWARLLRDGGASADSAQSPGARECVIAMEAPFFRARRRRTLRPGPSAPAV